MSLVLSAEQLRDELLKECEDVQGPDDQLLVCPQVEWLQRFGDVCRERIENIKSNYPANEANDCDDFTGLAIAWARDARNANKEFVNKGYGFAVLRARITVVEHSNINGIIGDGRTGHGCCIVRTPEGWMLFEPQTGDHELLDSALDRCALWSVGV